MPEALLWAPSAKISNLFFLIICPLAGHFNFDIPSVAFSKGMLIPISDNFANEANAVRALST